MKNNTRKQLGEVRFKRKERPGTVQPYQLQKLTVVGFDPDGTPLEKSETSTYRTREERDAVLSQARSCAERQQATLADAIGKYAESRRVANRRIDDEELAERAEQRVRSIERRLRGLFQPYLDRPLIGFGEQDAKARYAELAGTGSSPPWISPRLGRPLSGDTILNWISDARTFFDWAQEAGLLPRERANPLVRIKVRLPRNTGKDQPTPRERALLRQYVEQQAGVPTCRRGLQLPVDVAALHTGVLLVSGCRPSELLNRRPEEVKPSQHGATFEIPKGRGKTKNAARTIVVPGPVGVALLHLRAARAGQRYLMPFRGRAWSRRAVRRVCSAAGVRALVPYSFRGASISARLREQLESIAREHGQGSGAISERHYLSEEVRAEAEQALGGEARHRLDRMVLESRMETVLREMWQQGLFTAESGVLPILAGRLVAELDVSPQAATSAEPLPTGTSFRRT